MEEFLKESIDGIVGTTDGIAEILEVEPPNGQMSESEMQLGSIATGVLAVIMFLIIVTNFKGKGEKKSK